MTLRNESGDIAVQSMGFPWFSLMNGNTVPVPEQTKPETKQVTAILPIAMVDEIERFRLSDVRPTFNNAMVALLADGLEANRRRKPRRGTDPEAA